MSFLSRSTREHLWRRMSPGNVLDCQLVLEGIAERLGQNSVSMTYRAGSKATLATGATVVAKGGVPLLNIEWA